jgi:hypothetical protein
MPVANGALWTGSPIQRIWEVPEAVKARMFRAAVSAAMLAAVVQSLGAVVKW